MSKYTDDILTHLINSQTAVTKLKDGIEDLINDMDNLYAKVEDSIQMPDSVEIKIETDVCKIISIIIPCLSTGFIY